MPLLFHGNMNDALRIFISFVTIIEVGHAMKNNHRKEWESILFGGCSGAGNRDRTGTRLPSRDFKSRASANSATPAGDAKTFLSQSRVFYTIVIKKSTKNQPHSQKHGKSYTFTPFFFHFLLHTAQNFSCHFPKKHRPDPVSRGSGLFSAAICLIPLHS